MRKRLSLRALGTIAALALPAAACTPSIDASDVKAFEKSLAEAKRSLSPTDRTKLENAIFAIALDDTMLLSPAEMDARRVAAEHPKWAITLQGDLTVEGHRMAYVMTRSVFVGNLADRIKDFRITSSMKQKPNVEGPVAEADERLVTARKNELQKTIDNEGEIVTMSSECRASPVGTNRRYYTVKNESKWTIAGMTAFYAGAGSPTRDQHLAGVARHAFTPPLAPGDAATLVLSFHPPIWDECQIAAELSSVEVVGGSSFRPISRAEWLQAKERLQSLMQARGEVTKSLQAYMDWLRNIQ